MTALWTAVVEATEVLADWLEAERRSVAVARLPRPAWPIVAGSVARAAAEQGRPLVVLVPAPERFLGELRTWLAGRPSSYLFDEVAVNFLDRPPAFDAAVGHRLEALAALATEEACVVVSSRRAASRATISPAALRDATVHLAPRARGDPAEVARRLTDLGYTREALAEAAGQFSLRGGILDVYPAAGGAPVRAEWLGDEVETLRVFDPANQRSVMAVPRVTVRPGREVLLGTERGSAAAARARGALGLERLRADVRAEWEEELERLAGGGAFPGVELFAAYLDPALPSLFDHLPESTLVIDFEPERQAADVLELDRETATLAAAEAGDGELPEGFTPPMVPAHRLLNPGRPVLSVTAGQGADEDSAGLGWAAVEPVVGRPRGLADILEHSRAATVLITSEQTDRVGAAITDAGFPPGSAADLDLDLNLEAGLFRADEDAAAGCVHGGVGFWLLTDSELFGRIRRPVSRRGPRTPRGAPSLTLEFTPGELVVHVDHGIGRFQGMKLIESDGADREYLEIEYADGDRLFVPVESLDRVQKYLGGGEGEPVLHRLGTGDWERARSRARRSVEEVADDLLRLYSLREAKPGITFGPDSPWQGELEASFPYEETPDQLAAMAEIKADMEAPRPMDRLLCGDVGFGKTEVAVRAAFKAVMSGRQVAVLVPTTVLAQQHMQVFGERLRPYPVRLEVLSRFRSEEEQADTIAGIRSGAVDIVIGTHRLLQRDVRFKRLGLVVIDEEQRFGVLQKERLKRLRTEVDVLSLSATPIPRTLHMATAGLRDMSVIQTPPEDRQPIKTYVTGDDEDLVREVIRRELDRRGQVYFVHNRVRTIQAAAERVARLVPEARVAVGHGQMDEEDLARVMVEFAAGRHDVLVCTTIIESGLDIPNVNTLLVERADRFGLAQLYQLRGRVGRAGKRAYAYFLYDPRRSLTEAADRRLDVISGLHELGQGFRIALRDLEIRGAGNLLGTEQHGAIAAVGFEMYLQMLQSTVARLRGGEPVEGVLATQEMSLDLPLDHFIPRSYIRDERLRLGAYRELAAAESESELESHLRSLRDRYGPPPVQLDNLAYSLRVKIAGERLGLRAVEATGSRIAVRVDPDRELDVDGLASGYSGRIRVLPNRLLLETSPERWQADLLVLLERLEDSYSRERATTGA
jgi:transcription-repair coupling factor (superfamily II helicase)